MNNYTVIGYHEESGQIVSEHTRANNKFHAFFVVAQQTPTLTFVSVHDGHVSEGQSVDFPGEGVVDAATVLEQDDVFNSSAIETPAGPDGKSIDPVLLAALKHALNAIPNTKLGRDDYPDTYSLASALSRL